MSGFWNRINAWVKNAAGFSVIEIMVAVVIFSIGVLGLGALFPLAIRNVNQSAMMTRATQYAKSKMEDLMDAGAPTVTSGSDTLSGGYYRSWHVAPDSLSEGLTTVRVTVLWTSGGSDRRVNLSSTIVDMTK
jgi:prepilin-type N-terminal cleavage/methylation domain-containing protein